VAVGIDDRMLQSGMDLRGTQVRAHADLLRAWW
jgi:hypothetical protein